jgi:hypothetical protein
MSKKRRVAFIGTIKSGKVGPITQALLNNEITGVPPNPVILEAAKNLGYLKKKEG